MFLFNFPHAHAMNFRINFSKKAIGRIQVEVTGNWEKDNAICRDYGEDFNKISAFTFNVFFYVIKNIIQDKKE